MKKVLYILSNFLRKTALEDEAESVESLLSGLKNIEEDWDVTEHERCVKDSWQSGNNILCSSIGDCGMKNNYIGVEGYYNLTDLYELSERYDEEELEEALEEL